MTYSPEVKENACKMYREGKSPRHINETTGIPLSTIYGWVRNVYPLVYWIVCPVCKKEAGKTRPNRKYCSPECRRKAKYHRLKKTTPPPSRRCIECKTSFEPRSDARHTYCSKRCKNRAATRRKREKNKKNSGQTGAITPICDRHRRQESDKTDQPPRSRRPS